MSDTFNTKPYSWVPDSEVGKYSALVEKYRNLPSGAIGGGTIEVNGKDTKIESLKTIAKQHVPSEWERELSDVLFRVTGFSQFFGALAFQCKFYWSLDLPTAGAMALGTNFYVIINPIFFMEYLQKGAYRSFAIVHEVWHIFYEHGMRGAEAGYDPKLFNVACDYYIHSSMDAIIRNGAKTGSVELLPKDVFEICFDRKYDGWTEDEIYKDLEEEQKKNGGSKSGGSGGGKNGQQAFDLPPESNSGDGGSSSATSQEIASTIRAAATQAQMGKGVGDAEMGIIRKFLEMSEPKVDWRDQFANFFERTRDDKPTYAYYNRRSTDEVVFPSREGEKIRVGFGVDTSGSMSDSDLTEAMTELHGIVDQIGNWQIDVASCDSKAFMLAQLSSENEDDPTAVSLKGGGGTVMSHMVELFQQEWGDDAYNVIVIFTDGYLSHGDILNVYEHEIPLIVVVTRNGSIPEWLKDEVTVIQVN